LTIVYAAKGYPAKPEIGTEIRNLRAAEKQDGVIVFHAGTQTRSDGALIANGGRVLAVTGQGATIADAQTRAYAGVHAIDWPGGFYRADIGWRALRR
jgi:phosphoribosylamine--glycine ligase